MREGPKANKCFRLGRHISPGTIIVDDCCVMVDLDALFRGTHSVFRERWLGIAHRIINLSNTQKFSC